MPPHSINWLSILLRGCYESSLAGRDVSTSEGKNAEHLSPAAMRNGLGVEAPRYGTDAVGAKPRYRTDAVGGQNAEKRRGSIQLASIDGRKREQNRERKHEQDFEQTH